MGGEHTWCASFYTIDRNLVFPLLCPVTPTLHQNNRAPLLSPGGIKNNFSSDIATPPPAAAGANSLLWKRKSQKNMSSSITNSNSTQKHKSNTQNDGKLSCDFTMRSETRGLLSQQLFLFFLLLTLSLQILHVLTAFM